MNVKEKYSVLMILEGTYPFNGGGVSTWADMLCNKIKNVDYTLYSINANLELKSKYKLSENVKDVIQVPLWSPLEPQELINYGSPYFEFAERKENDNELQILHVFLPIFERFITSIYTDTRNKEDFDMTFFEMWQFFQIND